MISAGMDVARLNFSHGTHETHQRVVDRIRQLSREERRPGQIMQDLEGYRIRIGSFKDGGEIDLKRGQTVLLTNQDRLGERDIIPFDYEGSLCDIGIGRHIYIDDGNIALIVKRGSEGYLETEVHPEWLRERCDGCLRKPWRIHELRELVARLL